ncbi:MAG TPA: abortive infection family protein [Steroidobacteraceae bacterium]|jgi:hypothetical protein|nr:abortive infection family protein [Steroidobacteraceae bacterium]
MSDLTSKEKRAFEKLFEMHTGYVSNFTDRTFAEFFVDTVDVVIDQAKYLTGGTSKAKRLRAFWSMEPNHVVATLLGALVEHVRQNPPLTDVAPEVYAECDRAVSRLLDGAGVMEAAALQPLTAEPSFEIVCREVRLAIEADKLSEGLDRLHTFTMKFARSLCTKHGLQAEKGKPLHSVFGEYVRHLKNAGKIRSMMAEKILGGTTKVFDAFNDARNNLSLAHDNELLDHEESLLIFNHVCAMVRFVRSVEQRLDHVWKAAAKSPAGKDALGDDIPF